MVALTLNKAATVSRVSAAAPSKRSPVARAPLPAKSSSGLRLRTPAAPSAVRCAAPALPRRSLVVASVEKNTTEVADLDNQLKNFFVSATVSMAPLMMFAGEALAADEPHDILKGTTLALLHPVVMGILFATTLYSGYLGLQWRRTRTIAEDIKTAKAAVPVGADGAAIATSPEALKVKELTEERSTLLSGNFRDKHFVTSSILLAFGIFITVEGCLNTYTRTGRLFPGPHLYAGAAICCLWAFGAALVPAMQKGNDTARSLHIALATVNVGLFVWQIPTGLDIVGKVFQFTTFP